MTRCIGLRLVAAAFFGIAGQAQAATITVNDFTTITDGVFFDIPNTTTTSATFGGVTVTGPNAVASNANFGTASTPAAPGNDDGWSTLLTSPVTLDFDMPVAAFGMTVLIGSNSSLATLEAFSGTGGSGMSRGIVSSTAGTGSPSREFIGLWSDALDILSVVFTDPDNGSSPHTIDLYALSLTANVQTPPGPPPAPEPDEVSEPAALSLFGLGIAALGMARRRRSR